MKKTRTKNPPTFKKPYRLESWFEHDRAHVELRDANEETIIEWWDENVAGAIEDGFLDPRNFLVSATAYAREIGLL